MRSTRNKIQTQSFHYKKESYLVQAFIHGNLQLVKEKFSHKGKVTYE